MLPSRMSGGRYHSVTTSLEYVFVGIDFARAKPETNTRTHTHVSLKPHHHCLYTDSDYICILTAKINVFILRKDHDSHCLKRHFKYFLGVALQIDDGMMCSDSAVLNSPRRSFCLWLWRSDVCL